MSRPPPVELSFAAGSEHRTGWASPALSTDEKTEAQGGREGGHKRLCGEQWQGRTKAHVPGLFPPPKTALRGEGVS